MIKFTSNVWSYFQYWASNYTNPLINAVTKLFSIYTNVQTNISMKFNHYYYSNEIFHKNFNIFKHLIYKIDSYILDYNIEPIEENWINTSMFYLDENKKITLKEDYDNIYFNKDQELIIKTMRLKLVKFERLQIKELDNIKCMYFAKYKNKYFCKIDPVEFAITDLKEKFVSNPFIEIIYVNLDDDQEIEVELDKSYFVKGNNILSTVFLKRYFNYRSTPKDFVFSQNYLLKVTNFNFEEIEIHKNQYINLDDNKYTIENL